MPKLFSSREIVKVLENKGFAFVSQKGSHAKFFHIVRKLTVIVPANRKQIPSGTFSSILRQSKLSRENFEK
ncbi:MAG: type II toxin-antitoxin system HicA family toxin [Candidatus Taylorbacteria bacterium]